MIWLALFLSCLSVLACMCMRFGIPALNRHTLSITPSKTLNGFQANLVAGSIVAIGAVASLYVTYAIYMILTHDVLKHYS